MPLLLRLCQQNAEGDDLFLIGIGFAGTLRGGWRLMDVLDAGKAA